jgi:hypothetical protein
LGEAKRKAAAMTLMLESLEQAHAEGQGVWSIEVFHCSTIPKILVGAACGDRSRTRRGGEVHRRGDRQAGTRETPAKRCA